MDIAVSDTPTFDSLTIGSGSSPIVLSSSSGTITGLTNTTWDSSTYDASRAASEGEIKYILDKLNAGFTVSVDGKEVQVISLADSTTTSSTSSSSDSSTDSSSGSSTSSTTSTTSTASGSSSTTSTTSDSTSTTTSTTLPISSTDNIALQSGSNIVLSTADNAIVISADLSSVQTHYMSVNTTSTTAGNYNNDGAAATDSIAIGSGASVTSSADEGVALGKNATVSVADGVALGANSVASSATSTSSMTISGTTYNFAGSTASSTVSVGSSGNYRTITNVAAGQVNSSSTDAVNGSQLYSVAQAVEANTTSINSVSSTVSNLSDTVTNLGETVGKLGFEVGQVAAQDAALAALHPLAYDPNKPTQVMAGVGTYRGHYAGAIGLAHYSNDNVLFHIGTTLGQTHNTMNAGVSFKFGSGSNQVVPLTGMQAAEKLNALQHEVSDLKDQNNTLHQDNEQLKGYNERLLADNEKLRNDNAATKRQLAQIMKKLGM